MSWVKELKLDIKYFPKKRVCTACQKRPIKVSNAVGQKVMYCEICAETTKKETTKKNNAVRLSLVKLAKDNGLSTTAFVKKVYDNLEKWGLKKPRLRFQLIDFNSRIRAVTKMAHANNVKFKEFVELLDHNLKEKKWEL